MAILPISGANVSANRCTFSGRHNRNNEVLVINDEQPQHSNKASKLKSVPVALMIALAPMSAAGQTFDNVPKKEGDRDYTIEVVDPQKKVVEQDVIEKYARSLMDDEFFNKYFNTPNRKNIVRIVPVKENLLNSDKGGFLIFTRRPTDPNRTFHDIYYLPYDGIPYSSLEKDGFKVDIPHMEMATTGTYGLKEREYVVLHLTQQFRPTSKEDKDKLYARDYEIMLDTETSKDFRQFYSNELKKSGNLVAPLINDGFCLKVNLEKDSGIYEVEPELLDYSPMGALIGARASYSRDLYK